MEGSKYYEDMQELRDKLKNLEDDYWDLQNLIESLAQVVGYEIHMNPTVKKKETK